MGLAPDHEIHGTLVSIHGRGVLLCGPPASGKSSLAWWLVRRGHQLVVDDSPLFERRGADLYGRCRPGFSGLLHLPGAGLFDVRARHGPGAWLGEARVCCLVRLAPAGESARDPRWTELRGIHLPSLCLSPGRRANPCSRLFPMQNNTL